MIRVKFYLSVVAVLLSFVLAGKGAFAEDSSSGGPEALYMKAETLKEDGDYDAAFVILKKLADENPGEKKYQISYIDVVLEQCKTLKGAKDSSWKSKAKEMGGRIKSMQAANVGAPDYYLIYSKYSWIVEARSDRHIHKALEKAFYYKPNYYKAHILKGDVHFDLAKNTDPSEKLVDPNALTGGSTVQTRHSLALTARSSYESALSSSDISDKRKAYVYLMLGDLEDQLFQDKEKAKADWGKAASVSPDSKSGKAAKERLKH